MPKRPAARAADTAPVSTLAPSGAIVSPVMATRVRNARTRDEAFSADIAIVNSVIREAATGRTARMIDLLKSSRVRDPRLGAVCRTRVHALQRPYVLAPPSGYETDREALEITRRCLRIFTETPGFGKVIGHLGHGTLEGFGVAEHDWRKNVRGEIVSTPGWRHPNRFAWDTSTSELCKSEPQVDAFPGEPLSTWPGKFIVHAPIAGESDYPWHRGVMRSRAIASVLKRSATRWGMKALERWGQPQVYVTTPDGESAAVTSEVMDSLRALSSQWHARFPQGVEPRSIPVQLDGSVHLAWIQYQATEDAIAILGQNLTTEVVGGSYAAAQAHKFVRLDILASDLAELAETLVDQWIRLLVEYNWPGAPVPVLDFILAPKGEITVEKFRAGLYTINQVRAADGFDPEPDGDRKYVDPGVAPVPMYPLAQVAPPAAPKPSITPEVTTDLPVEAAPAAPDVAGTGLNGAQIKELKQLVLDIAAGVFPRASAEAFIGVAFPSVSVAQIAGMLPPIGFTPAITAITTLSAPLGGAVAVDPFAMASSVSRAMGTSPTSSPSRHPLARWLSQS